MSQAKPDHSGLILPDNPLFGLTLNSALPPGWENGGFFDFVNDPETGILVPISKAQLSELVNDTDLLFVDAYEEGDELEDEDDDNLIIEVF